MLWKPCRELSISNVFDGGDVMVSERNLHILPWHSLSPGSKSLGLLQLSGVAMTVPKIALGFAL